MPSAFEVLGSVYEASTVITDVVLNKEYIDRGWKEEYALSIAFLAFNGLVMAVVGLQLEAKDAKKRYVRTAWLNGLIGAVIGVLQLRVLVETLHTYAVAGRAEKAGDESSHHQPMTTQGQTAAFQQPPAETEKQRAKRLETGLLYAVFVQAMVRDVPLFVIQANATIHYRKWELVDLWAVVSTGVTLVNAVARRVNNSDEEKEEDSDAKPKASTRSKVLGVAATVFLLGQFIFRLGAILLVATTKGSVVVVYSLAITAFATIAAVVLRLATPAQATGAQVASAILFFPLFTVFTLDAAQLGHGSGTAKRALYSAKLLALNGWRVLENAVGVVLATTLPRYTDFGASTDKEIATIGVVCAAIYIVSLLVFVVAASVTEKEKSVETEEMEEDTMLYLQQQHEASGPTSSYIKPT